MNHRHIVFSGCWNSAFVDDVISRGDFRDWQELGSAALFDSVARDSIRKVCRQYCDDPYEQKYIAWKNYLEFIEEKNKIILEQADEAPKG